MNVINILFRKFWGKFLILLLLVGLASIFQVSFGYLIKEAVDSFGQFSNTRSIWAFIFAFLIIRFMMPMSFGFVEYVAHSIIIKAESFFRVRYFNNVHNPNFEIHKTNGSGDIHKRISSATFSIRVFIRSLFVEVLPVVAQIVALAITIYIAFDLNIWLMFCTVIVAYLIAVIFLTNQRIPMMRRMADYDRKLSSYALDTFSNHESIQVLSSQNVAAKRFVEKLNYFNSAQYRLRNGLIRNNIISSSISVCGSFGVLYFVAQGVIANIYTAGSFVMISTFLFQVFLPMNRLGFQFRELRGCLIDFERVECIDSLLNEEQLKTVHSLRNEANTISLKKFSVGSICLKGINFTTEVGCPKLIIGESGCGKSTLVKSLLRLTEGSAELYINGVDISEYSKNQLRNDISLVTQQQLLFNDTILENFRYAHSHLTAEDVSSLILQFKIKRDPEDKVGEHGRNLSAGEISRLK
ncbi:MAG: ABC transporter ATP-binding protein, partial [Balneolales bacterium]